VRGRGEREGGERERIRREGCGERGDQEGGEIRREGKEGG
jgi:hypothetical protein